MTPRIPRNPYGGADRNWRKASQHISNRPFGGSLSKSVFSGPRKYASSARGGIRAMPAGQLFNTPTKYRPRAFGITLRPHIMGSGSQGKSTALTKYRFPMAAGNPPMKRMLIHRGNVHLWAGGALAATAAIGAGAYAIHRHNRPKPRIAIKSTHHRKVKRGPKGRFAGSY